MHNKLRIESVGNGYIVTTGGQREDMPFSRDDVFAFESFESLCGWLAVNLEKPPVKPNPLREASEFINAEMDRVPGLGQVCDKDLQDKAKKFKEMGFLP